MKKTIAVLFVLSLLTSPCQAADPLTVTRCIDGNTLQLSNGEKVRLIGVDTPEASNNAKTRRDSKRTGQDIETITKMGKEAAEFTRKLVEGKEIRLEYDVQKKDKYGRTLAYVYLNSYQAWDSDPNPNEYRVRLEDMYYVFLNASIVQAGYAQAMIPSATDASADSAKAASPNVKYADLFLKLQKEARENKRGLFREVLQIYKPDAKRECLKRGGQWRLFGEHPNERCNLPTIDAGAVCKDGKECQGDCIAVITKEQEKGLSEGKALTSQEKCTPYTMNFGCHPFVTDGEVRGIMCVD